MEEKYKIPTHLINNKLVKFMDRTEISAIISSLGNALSMAYQNQDLTLVALLKGGGPFLANLVREIKGVRLTLDFLQIEYLPSPDKPGEDLKITKDISLPIKDQNVLLVSDMTYRGNILAFASQRIGLGNPKKLETLSFFHRQGHPTLVPLNYVGKSFEDSFVIGHGLDLEGYGRNLQNIFTIRYPI